jgi:hypothetical protein
MHTYIHTDTNRVRHTSYLRVQSVYVHTYMYRLTGTYILHSQFRACTCIHTYICTYVHIQIESDIPPTFEFKVYTYIHTYMYRWTGTYILHSNSELVRTYIHIHIHTYTDGVRHTSYLLVQSECLSVPHCRYVCVSVCIHIYTYMYMYMYIRIYVYIYTHKHTSHVYSVRMKNV